MRTIKGPGLFLAQFVGEKAPFDRLESLAKWSADLGYLGLQLPTFDRRILDLDEAASSEAHCEEITAMLAGHGLVITELSTHRQGHLMAVHPAYERTLEVFMPEAVRGNRAAWEAWARDQLLLAARASARLGLKRHVTFSGSLAWPYVYPYPPRPAGLVEEAFAELAKRWRPILDAFDEVGVDLCFEIHPGEDLHDGATFERFLELVDHHPRCNILYDPSHLLLQHVDYLDFLDIYRERIKVAHIKDAEFRRSGRTGVWGGYLDWSGRAGRFRSLGDGDIDFGKVFSKLAGNDFEGWAVVEWECALENAEDGARKGAAFVRDHIIRVTERPFDAGMGRGAERSFNRAVLGLD